VVESTVAVLDIRMVIAFLALEEPRILEMGLPTHLLGQRHWLLAIPKPVDSAAGVDTEIEYIETCRIAINDFLLRSARDIAGIFVIAAAQLLVGQLGC
jgi:hypothetical protein